VSGLGVTVTDSGFARFVLFKNLRDLS
jgi:hypothetical protein